MRPRAGVYSANLIHLFREGGNPSGANPTATARPSYAGRAGESDSRTGVAMRFHERGNGGAG